MPSTFSQRHRRQPAHNGWWIVIRLHVHEVPTHVAMAAGCLEQDIWPSPPLRAIGPLTWTQAVALSSAWDREFGYDTTRVTDAPRSAIPRVNVLG